MTGEDNVKVAVRVRPLLPKEKLAGDQRCAKAMIESRQILMGKNRTFAFDFVIGPNMKQEDVFDTCIADLVECCFEGYNSTVFAYGQTGSGKTFTIGGTSDATHTDDELGIIPRALELMFSHIESTMDRDFQVTISYMEVYMEDLKDLLDLKTSSKDITIREDEQGNTVVSGMREVPCQTIDEVLYCLQHGSSARSTGSTQMNEHSSRSHAVFTVHIEQQWKAEQGTVEVDDGSEQYHHLSSQFHFVDLAGSERAHRTKNVGDRFKESIHINSGLLALGNVISALADPKRKSSHIPYRDSKITRLLKDSLGGNSKTLMICCISPSSADFDESLNSLKFANRARNIKNKPVVNRDLQSLKFEEMQNEIQALRKELEKKESMIREESNMTHLESREGDLKSLELKISSLQDRNSTYLHLIEMAAEHLSTTKPAVPESARGHADVWLEQWTQIREMGEKEEAQETILQQFSSEIKRLTELLRNDEEIFNEKSKQAAQLMRDNEQLEIHVRTLSTELESAHRRVRELEEVLLEQQIRLDTVMNGGEDTVAHASLDVEVERRAKSVPAHGVGRLNLPSDRPVHTSPALFTVERYLQGFRARSQMLVDRLDDEDEVLHHPFPGDAHLPDEEDSELSENVPLSSMQKGKSERQRGRTLSFGSVVIRQPSEEEGGEMSEVKLSMDRHQKEIRQAKLKSQEFNSRLRDLTIAIRMKEQLIRQLVKNEKDSAQVVRQHKDKITSMEEEKMKMNKELADLQKEFAKLEAREKMELTGKKKLQTEFKRKIDSAKRKLTNLQHKQTETVNMARLTEQTDEKINELRLAVSNMRQQQEELTKKLKQEHDKKEKLEKNMAKEQHRVKELENITEQQQKILKIKTEEVAAVTRKLRKGSSSSLNDNSNNNVIENQIQDQKKWLDAEMDKMLEQRKQMEQLQKELESRAQILERKENVLKEKGQLELKQLRMSQSVTQSFKADLNRLHKERSDIQSQKSALGAKFTQLGELPVEDQRRLLELEEAVEALDAAIEYKNDIIEAKQQGIRRSQILTQHEDNLSNRLRSLGTNEAQQLLQKYFMKVVELKELSRAADREQQSLEMQLAEQTAALNEMEAAIAYKDVEYDRALTEQQQQYEAKISALLQPINDSGRSEAQIQQAPHGAHIKIQQLEKDLYYYKKTSRDLKKKLREVMVRIGEQAAGAGYSADSHVEDSAEPNFDHEQYRIIPLSPRHSPTFFPPLPNTNSPGGRPSITAASSDSQHVKISRKDLRHVSQEEIQTRRSQVSQSAHSIRASNDSLDGY